VPRPNESTKHMQDVGIPLVRDPQQFVGKSRPFIKNLVR
jgi:hypothetical protein